MSRLAAIKSFAKNGRTESPVLLVLRDVHKLKPVCCIARFADPGGERGPVHFPGDVGMSSYIPEIRFDRDAILQTWPPMVFDQLPHLLVRREAKSFVNCNFATHVLKVNDRVLKG
jgi:hypothetical protein